MLNSPLPAGLDYNNNIIINNNEIVRPVEFCQGDETYQAFNKNLIKNDVCQIPYALNRDPISIQSPAPCAAEYVSKCDPCAGTKSVTSSWEWFGLFVLWFIALTVLFWLVFYSLKPPFVLQSDGNQVDTAKVLLAAVISAFVLIVIIWLIKAAMGK